MKRLLSIPALLLCGLSYSQVRYHVTVLGNLGGPSSFALGINASGVACGASLDHTFVTLDACTFTPAGIQNMGTLGGSQAEAQSINTAGQIVGWSYITGINAPQHAFLFSGGSMHDLGTLGGNYSYARGINNPGQIVGESTFPGNSYYHAFSFQGGQMTDIGTLGGQSSFANGINSSGQIAGYSNYDSSGYYHSFIYTNGAMQDIGTLSGYPYSEAASINDSDQVVGYCEELDNNGNAAFLYSNGVMQNLGFIPFYQNSFATCINNSGQIVGYCQNYGGTASVGFLYSGGAMVDLNTLLDSSGVGIVVEDGCSISDSGVIAGYGTIPQYPQGQEQALLLTPLASNVTLPGSYSIIIGNQTGGSLYSIQFNDSWYLTVLPGATTLLSQAPVQVQLSGSSPTKSPSNFQFTFSGHVNSINLAQTIQLYNFTTGGFETLNTTGAHVGSDSTVTVTPTGDLTRFVNQSTGEVRARVNFSRTGAVSVLRWTASLGVVNWIIQ